VTASDDGSSDEARARRRSTAFPALLVLFAVLYAWRMSGVVVSEPITNHLSNFYLSGAALTLLIGPRAFHTPSRPRVLATAGALLALNLLGEIVLALVGLDDEVNDAMGNVNTSDPVDGIFGIAGVLLVLLMIPRMIAPRQH
jgi:hypothetical protein